ncbi:hypothetical protein D1AOALGA4SA_6183 [Olavius algarvensis Delta 1 endosymbiont]|nr:hypothetical protein D1AOALGA4SA_6183 [Olavius algarvensis Delta 1 endosymbiont]
MLDWIGAAASIRLSSSQAGQKTASLIQSKTIEWTHKRKNSHYISMIR